MLLVSAAPGGAADPCGAGARDAWFVGVVHDSAKRQDFILDVFNFEFYLDVLREVYCIPSSSATILAFDGAFMHGGTSYSGYPVASEAAFRAKVAEFGSAAGAADGVLFVALSSHGLQYPSAICPGGVRTGGSHAALRSGGGHDGTLRDCELGAALNAASPRPDAVVMVDCSFCGGFSESFTAASGTAPNHPSVVPSGIVGPGRIVITGCAETTECFGSNGGGVTYKHMRAVLEGGLAACDGWTAPGFPLVQGADLPARIGATDGVCGTSELFFAAVQSAYDDPDLIGIQQQFRMKYGFETSDEDLAFAV